MSMIPRFVPAPAGTQKSEPADEDAQPNQNVQVGCGVWH